MATTFPRRCHSPCFFWYVTSKKIICQLTSVSCIYHIILFSDSFFDGFLRKMAGQGDIWKALQNIFKIFHSKASLQWGKLCLAIHLIKLCLAILEALFFWLYHWLVLGDKSYCCKQRFHLMQLTWNYGEPHIFLHKVFQRFC